MALIHQYLRIPSTKDRIFRQLFIVSKYYSFARTGTYPLMSLNCNSFTDKPEQPDCRTYLPDGQLTFENRYDISKSFFHISSDHNYTPSEMFQKFIQQVNSQMHDDGFKVLLLNQFGFDSANNVLYLKNFPSFSGTTTNVVPLQPNSCSE
jgi:hypothetical protein